MATATISPIYKPHPKQVLLHNAPVGFDEISITLYGGQRGGGKSAGILMDMIFFCTTYPLAKCCVLRENLSAVRQSFLDQLPALFPEYMVDPVTNKRIRLYEYKEKGGRYPDRTMVFPNGSYITFQRVENLKEAKEKQGWAFHYLAIDEVTKQEEDTVNYLLSCVRSTIITNPYTGRPLQIPTKVVFGCNPGGIGHKWVKKKFIDTTTIEYDKTTNAPIRTKDYVYYTEHPDGGAPIKTTVRFIPASWRDNPFLSRAYIAMLDQQPEYLRQMDMFGNWDIVAGKMFEYEDDSFLDAALVREELNLSDAKDIYISIDWGYKPSYHSVGWWAVFSDSSALRFMEMYGQELIFEDFVKEIAERSTEMDITATLLPHDMFRSGDRYRDDTGRIIGETKADVFNNAGLNPVGVESGKGKYQMRMDKVHSASKIIMTRNGCVIKKFRFSKNCRGFKDEVDNAVHDDFDPTQLAPACKDHAIDEVGLFFVYYSSDIAPMGDVPIEEKDLRGKTRRSLEDEEKRLMEEDEIYSNNYTIIDDWDL